MKRQTKSKSIEGLRVVFFQLGLILSMSTALVAFEWNSFEMIDMSDGESWIDVLDELVVPVTHRKVMEIPKPIKQNVSNMLKIVPDEVPELSSEPVIYSDDVDSINMDFFEDEPGDIKEEIIPFMMVEERPVFPGCEGLDKDKAYICFQQGVMKLIQDEVIYPKEAKDMDIEGTVYVSFVIDNNGKVTKAKVVREVDKYLDKEALRLVNSLPQMTPAKQRDIPVAILFNIPIDFNIN